MNWYLEVLKKYAVFSGRASRKEYWYFVLVNVIITAVLKVIDQAGTFSTEADMGLMEGIYSLAVMIPSIAVTVRRLHDTDHSGWWLLVALIPILGIIVLLVFTAQNGKPGENRYGHGRLKTIRSQWLFGVEAVQAGSGIEEGEAPLGDGTLPGVALLFPGDDFSRRGFVAAFRHARQRAWFDGSRRRSSTSAGTVGGADRQR